MSSGRTEQEMPGNAERRQGAEEKVDDGEAIPARIADAEHVR